MNSFVNKMTTPPSTPLSVELRALIDQRNILTAKSKTKVLNVLDEHITAKDREAKDMKHQTLKYKIMEEIFTSEESYLRNLEVAMKFFRDGIREAKLSMPPQLKLLFDHLESLYNVNGELLDELRCHGEDIGSAFKKMAPFFKLYSVYAFDYRAGLQSLHEIGKTNAKLEMFIMGQESRPEVHCKLSSLLISPIQRIPRYRLLLRQLLSHLPPDHPHYASLTEGVREVEKATRHIDSLVCEQETMGRMIELQKSLIDGTHLIQPGRKLIREGIVNKVSKKSERSKARYLILTSDELMLCKLCGEKSLRCTQTLQLRAVSVCMSNDRVFNVSCNAISIDLFSNEPYASEAWVQAISSAVQQITESEGTLKRGGSVRLALLRKDLNRLTDSLTPRKRKQSQMEDEVANSNESPWKRNKSKTNDPHHSRMNDGSGAGPSGASRRKPGYFSSFRKAITSISHTLQKYWIPALTGKENNFDRRLT